MLTYILLLIISFSLTYFIKNYAVKKSLIAEVNDRSSHTVPTPHGGGVAIAITWFVGLIYLFIINEIDYILFYSLLLGIIICIVSFLDDIYELSPKLRLIVQSVVAVNAIIILGGLEVFTIGIYDISFPLFTNVFAFFMIIWFINLTNFIDGINGYVGSEFVFLSIAGFILFGGNHFLILGVAVLGFLFWNWNKAKIFMGDVGSTLLGYNISIFTIYYANEEYRNLWIWITLFGVFWFDATYTLIKRKLNKEKLSEAHKKHVYQRLTQVNWSHYKVTNYSIFINISIFLFIYLFENILISFLLTLVMLYLIVLFVNQKKNF